MGALVPAVVLRTQLAAGVHLAADDVRMDIDASGHDHQPCGVDDLRLVAADRFLRDDATVLHPDVADFSGLSVLRVEDPSTDDAKHQLTASMIRSRMSSSVGRSVEMTFFRGIGTLSMR